MPGRNSMGPLNEGPMTGRGFGPCNRQNRQNYNYGRGFRGCRSFGRGQRLFHRQGYKMQYGAALIPENDEKSFLADQREQLQRELAEINKRLEEF